MSDIAIKVENISKRYLIGENKSYPTLRDKISNLFTRSTKTEVFWALKHVSFEIKKGEVVGIIGKNGAGKSTLLKTLARITEPSGGQITMYGRVASMLEVGTGFNPELTGRENIYLNGAIIGMTKKEIKEKFGEIVTFSGIERFLDTPVKHYSSGMYVRLAFAVAAHLDADILLVDEVLAVGDIEFQKKCLRKMESLSHSGRTIIYVSHNMTSIASLCNKAIYMIDGKIDTIGSTQTVLDKYYKSMKTSTKSAKQLPRGDIVSLTAVHANLSDKTLTVSGTLTASRAVSKVNIGISLHDESGRVMAIIYSQPSHSYTFRKGSNIFSLTISDVNLTPGLYTVRTRIESQGSEIYWPKVDVAQFTVPHRPEEHEYRSEIFANGQLLLKGEWQ